MKKLIERPVPDQYRELHAQLATLSGTMMRHFMRYAGLTVPENNISVSGIAHLAVLFLQDGHLTIGQIQAMIVDCYEHSNKSVYLYKGDAAQLMAWHPSSQENVITDRANARINASTGPERLNYIYVDDLVIRFSFSELHTDVRFDPVTEQVSRNTAPKSIVIEAIRQSGYVSLMMDAPSNRHVHNNKKIDYYHYWQARVGVLLGMELTPVSLGSALRSLAEKNLVQIRHTDIVRGDVTISISANHLDTIKDCPEYDTLCLTRAAYDKDIYWWMPQPHTNGSATAVPCREVKTKIFTPASEVKFMLDTLGCEVDYVMGHLRANA